MERILFGNIIGLTSHFSFKFQMRNSKASHLCLDQGVKENHTAILHPCHGFGPQVQTLNKILHSTSLTTVCASHLNTNNLLVLVRLRQRKALMYSKMLRHDIPTLLVVGFIYL